MTAQRLFNEAKRMARLPVTIDGTDSKPLPTPRINLKRLDGVRNEMARVYRAMKAGELDGTDGTKRAYVLSLIGKLIAASELERRVEALEQRISRSNSQP